MESTECNDADLRECVDREAIRDVLYRYARGIDRCSSDLLETVYWPESIDEHGDYNGSGDGFIKWVISTLQNGVDCTLHLMGNSLIRIDGTNAAVETYFQAFHRFESPPPGHAEDMIAGGRYVDRMEKRGKQWRIAHRIVVFDYFREFEDTGRWITSKYLITKRVIGARTPADPSDVMFGNQLRKAPFEN